MDPQPIIASLRAALMQTRPRDAFVVALRERMHHLLVDMVDGTVVPTNVADNMRAAIAKFVREEALPYLANHRVDDAFSTRELMTDYGCSGLADDDVLAKGCAREFPAPAPLHWPETDALAAAQAEHPTRVTLHPGIVHTYFATRLQREGAGLPPELLALYARWDGFSLLCVHVPEVTALALVPHQTLRVLPSSYDRPERVAPFTSSPHAQVTVYRERSQWWMSFEHDGEALAKKKWDLQTLLQHALAQHHAPHASELEETLAWDGFFGM